MSVSFSLFPSPRGVELHKRRTTDDLLIPGRMFPSPRGVELHKLGEVWSHSWDPEVEFPSPRGVELHKQKSLAYGRGFIACFRPLAGLSCINLS